MRLVCEVKFGYIYIDISLLKYDTSPHLPGQFLNKCTKNVLALGIIPIQGRKEKMVKLSLFSIKHHAIKT
jgi:hypothetical protein